MRKFLSAPKIAVGAAMAAVVAVSAAAPALAIHGGTQATQPYSFLGSLQVPDDYPQRVDNHKCGVTLLAAQWAVTATHCARNTFDLLTGTPRGWQVRFGSLAEGSGGEVADVDKFYRLAHFGHGMFGNDVSLLHLAKPVKAAPTRLASTSPAPGTPVRIVGWGNTCTGGGRGPQCYPERLRQADTVIKPSASCNGEPTEICAGSPGIGAGNTDSGGPALVKENGQWVIAGVLSGPGTDEVSETLYTDVTKHADWIGGIISGARVPADDPVPDVDLAGGAALGGCVGSVVQTPAGKPGDPALLLTNGHCVEGNRPAPGTALVDQPADRKVAMQDRNGWVQATARANRLLYATMTGTDLAVYRLDKTYRQLAAAGVKTFTLASVPLRAGDRLSMLTSDARRACSVAAVVPHLREDGYQQDNSVRYDTCVSNHGDSGSPLLSPDGKTVVGINNTSNDDGAQCTANNPCEVGADGKVTAVKGRSYGQQTYQLVSCLTRGSKIDLSRPGCTVTGAGK